MIIHLPSATSERCDLCFSVLSVIKSHALGGSRKWAKVLIFVCELRYGLNYILHVVNAEFNEVTQKPKDIHNH